MNAYRCELDELHVDKQLALEALQCLVHTVIFTRGHVFSDALEEVEPAVVSCNTMPLTYSSCDMKTSARLWTSLALFLNSNMLETSPNSKRGDLYLHFAYSAG